MTRTTVAALASFVTFLALDAIWLSTATRVLYRPQLGHLLLERPVLAPAVAFYLLYGIGLTVLVLRPAIASGGPLTALWTGAVLGLIAYGTYDLTNQATVRGWSWAVTLADMAWGAILSGVSAALGLWIAQRVA